MTFFLKLDWFFKTSLNTKVTIQYFLTFFLHIRITPSLSLWEQHFLLFHTPKKVLRSPPDTFLYCMEIDDRTVWRWTLITVSLLFVIAKTQHPPVIYFANFMPTEFTQFLYLLLQKVLRQVLRSSFFFLQAVSALCLLLLYSKNNIFWYFLHL